ncbi:HAD family hydrolase [Actinoplanes sp. NPDC051513]|uniref:HAD family hydrolase n=1 Tax=Actinoplanes sp. NPDC051513 TaxID=3363908 RepID=UPI0037B8D404
MRPGALLLDFGGVLADAPPQRPAPPALVLRIYNLSRGALTPGEIQRALTDGAAAWARWRDEDWPDELSQAEVWERFVMPGWPPAARVPVRGAVKKLSYDWAYHDNWELRPGIPEALCAARDADIPLAVVSNTLSGAAHRDFLKKAEISGFFAAQIYSDEAGVRKPNPQMIWNATDVLGVPPESCWFVGDSRRRDILCARRADAAMAILMRSPRTAAEPAGPWPIPDETIADGFELCQLLQKHL